MKSHQVIQMKKRYQAMKNIIENWRRLKVKVNNN